MKKIFSLIIILLFFLGHSQDFSKLLNNVELHNYYGENLYNKIIIADKIHLEAIDEKFTIKSSMEWLNKNKLELKIIDLNVPNFPYEKGEKMLIEFIKIENEKFYYKATVREYHFDGYYIITKHLEKQKNI